MIKLSKLLNCFVKGGCASDCYKIFLIPFAFCFISLYSVPDLTIVGNVILQDGLGKIPVNILETLGDEISANVVVSHSRPIDQKLSPCVIAALENRDKTPGKVALLTAALWYQNGTDRTKLPAESFVKLAYSMFETTRIPKKWVEMLNEDFDGVVVPDKYLVEVYKNSGVNIPIFVLPIPMKLNAYYERPTHPNFPSTPFIFGDASANKNPAVLVEAFAKAFGNNPEVQLVLKAGGLWKENQEKIKHLISQYGLTNVKVEEGHIHFQEYVNRLASFDCFVNLSRGEGFSLIPREALALGLPVIITNNTASTTICESGFVRAVSSLRKVPPLSVYKVLFNTECGEQFDCEVEDVVTALHDVYGNYGKYIKKARQGRKWVEQYNCTNTNLQKLYRTLIKPKKVIVGERNLIKKNGVIVTNSFSLYQKYQQIIDSNK